MKWRPLTVLYWVRQLCILIFKVTDYQYKFYEANFHRDCNFKLFNLTSDSYKSISNKLSRKINDFNISLDAIIRYDPTTYEGRSPKYEEIWDVLKQQASLVTFIRDLVLARGQVALAPRFIELTTYAKARKLSEGYKCTREEECVLLAKSWVS